MVLSVENTNNKETVKRKFDFAQEIAGKFLAGTYNGEEVTVAAEATAVQEGA